MKVPYSNLANAFHAIKQIASAGFFGWKPLNPSVLFESDSGTLTLTGTNMESWIKCSFAVEGASNERFVLGVNELSRFLSATRAVAVEISLDGEIVRVRPSGAGERCAQFEFLAVDECYPDCNTEDTWCLCEVPTHDFNSALSRVLFAVSSDESKIALTGVLLEGDGNELCFVATDGARLARAKLCDVADWHGRVLIPGNLLKRLRGTFKGSSVEIRVGERAIVFISGEDIKQTILLRLLDAEFPDYKAVYPDLEQVKAEVLLDRLGLIAAIEGATVVSKERVSLFIQDGEMVIRASSHAGRFEERLQLKEGRGELKISFQPRYLLEPLKAIDSAVVRMRFTGEVAPVMLLAYGYEYLFMPMDGNDEEVENGEPGEF